jgi:hypothetical protein
MRDAVFLFARVRFIAKGVAVDDSRSRIGEEGERHVAAMVGGDELRELPAFVGRIRTDRVELHFGVRAGELTKSGNLPGAVRSPVAAVENEDDLRPRRASETDASSILIAQRERRRRLANLRPRHVLRCSGGGDGEEQRSEEWQAVQG